MTPNPEPIQASGGGRLSEGPEPDQASGGGRLFKLPAAGKHVSPPENAVGGFQSCQNGRLGGAAVTAEVRTVNPLSLEFCVPLGAYN